MANVMSMRGKMVNVMSEMLDGFMGPIPDGPALDQSPCLFTNDNKFLIRINKY